MGILTFLLILPLFGAALIAVLPSASGQLIRGVALGIFPAPALDPMSASIAHFSIAFGV